MATIIGSREASNCNTTVFVGGLQKPCDRQALQQNLEQDFGAVASITILKEASANPYAFVTFDCRENAQKALAVGECEQPILYERIKPKPDPKASAAKKEIKANHLREQQKLEFQRRLDLVGSSTVALQVDRSHLDRLEGFLVDRGRTSAADPNVPFTDLPMGRVLLVNRTGFLFIDGVHCHEILNWVECHLPFSLVGLVKVFGLDPVRGVQRGGITELLRHWTNEISRLIDDEHNRNDGRTGNDLGFRLEMSPSSLQAALLAELEKDTSEDFSLLYSKLTPTQYTHSLTAIQLYCPSDGDALDGLGGLYVTSVESRREPPSLTPKPALPDTKICRAYQKLEEAFVRYGYEHKLPQGSENAAIDCGAAPGGWTQYLLDNESHSDWSCQTIYAIDPGKLDAAVASNPTVKHLAVKLEEGLPLVARQFPDGADIWVSDMCLHEMGYQVDVLLDAIGKRLLRADAFFVITLKCNQGHSKQAFDEQVAEQRKRLEGCTRDLLTFHLFSNRKGERTIAGYVT